MNEHEIRERIHLAELELLGVARTVNTIHTNLLMRHFAEARLNFIALVKQANVASELIPDEPGE